MSGARLTRPFRLMKRSGVTECPVMRDVCMVNRPVAAFRTGKMQKNEEATRAAISHRKRAARELNSGYYWLLLPSLGCWFLTANMVMLWHS